MPDRAAAELIRAGELVAFPTETVYGLGANALDAAAVAKIFELKGRPATSPLIVHVASIEMARELVREWPRASRGTGAALLAGAADAGAAESSRRFRISSPRDCRRWACACRRIRWRWH